MLTFGTHKITTATKCAALASIEGNLAKNCSNNCARGPNGICRVSTVAWRSTPVLQLEYVSASNNKCEPRRSNFEFVGVLPSSPKRPRFYV